MDIKIDKIDDLQDGSAHITFSADIETMNLLASFGFKQAIVNAVNEVSHKHMSLQDKYDLTKTTLESILNDTSGDIDMIKLLVAKTLDKIDPITG